MSVTQKFGESMRRSLPHLPQEARQLVEGMLQPQTLSIIAAKLMVLSEGYLLR